MENTQVNQYAQMSHEELLQKVEELQARVDQFENIDESAVIGENIYVKVDFQDADRIQSAIRNLVASLNPDQPDDWMIHESDLYFAMKLLRFFSPDLFDVHHQKSSAPLGVTEQNPNTGHEDLQEIEQLKGYQKDFAGNASRLVTSQDLYLKLELEYAYDIQKALRDLVAFFPVDQGHIHAHDAVMLSMQLLDMLTPNYFELKNLNS